MPRLVYHLVTRLKDCRLDQAPELLFQLWGASAELVNLKNLVVAATAGEPALRTSVWLRFSTFFSPAPKKVNYYLRHKILSLTILPLQYFVFKYINIQYYIDYNSIKLYVINIY